MSELVITKERVLSAARKNPQSKKLLTELFPDAFKPDDDDELFCFANDLFVRKNSNGILSFCADRDTGDICIINISDRRPWGTKIGGNYGVLNGLELRHISITKGDMRKLLKGASVNLEDIYVIQKGDIDRLKENIKQPGCEPHKF